MAKIIRKTYRVEDLPPGMVAEIDAAPDQLVRVTSMPVADETSTRCSSSPDAPAARPGGEA